MIAHRTAIYQHFGKNLRRGLAKKIFPEFPSWRLQCDFALITK
jgi:hypothetical protein